MTLYDLIIHFSIFLFVYLFLVVDKLYFLRQNTVAAVTTELYMYDRCSHHANSTDVIGSSQQLSLIQVFHL